MIDTANSHLEWGYLVPAPGLIRTTRLVFVATAVGAMIGAGVGFSLAGHPATETSVAARTLIRPNEAESVRANTPAQVAQAYTPSPIEKRSPGTIRRSADGATNERGGSSGTSSREDQAASAEAPAAIDGRVTTAISARATTVKQVATVTPTKKNATRKPIVIWRYASRDEPLGFALSVGHGGNYREGRRWGVY